MARNFISPFCADLSPVHAVMESNTGLPKSVAMNFVKGIAEFCTQFNLQVISATESDVHLVTEDGLYVGELSYKYHHAGFASGNHHYFHFKSPLIRKQKGSARSSTNARDSEKITGIIAAMKKANEVPVYKTLTASYVHAIRCAMYEAYGVRNKKPQFSLEDNVVLDLARFYIKGYEYNLAMRKDDLISKLQAYDDELQAIEDAKKSLHRFNDCYVIGACQDPSASTHYYMIGEATYDPATESATLTTKLERHATLKTTRHAALAMMVRTYVEGKYQLFDPNNELGLRRMDKYLEDLDVAVGYSNNQSIWMVVPKNAG